MAASSALVMVCVSSCPDASMYVVVFVGEWITEAPCLGFPSLWEPSVYVHASGLWRGCQGIGCGGVGLSGGFDVFLGLGRVGRLGSVFGSCVSAVCVAVFCVCVVSVACVISHVSILMSGACPSIWHLSVSDRPGAVVVPRWNPMRCSLIVALGSDSVSLK